MNYTSEAMPLNPAVSTALAGWLALNPPERRTLHHAIMALSALDNENDGRAVPSEVPLGPIHRSFVQPSDAPITLDTIPAFDRDLFRSASYRNLGPGEPLAIYAAGSQGLFGLVRQLQMPLYKIGFSRDLGIETRIAQLRQTAYGSYWRHGTEVVEDKNFRTWQAKALQIDDPRPENSPVHLLPKGLAVDLPAGITADAFDHDLRLALDPRAIDRLSTTEAGRALCEAHAVDPARLRRLTRRGQSHLPARELYRFDARIEAPRLVLLIEALVARSVATLLGQGR